MRKKRRKGRIEWVSVRFERGYLAPSPATVHERVESAQHAADTAVCIQMEFKALVLKKIDEERERREERD